MHDHHYLVKRCLKPVNTDPHHARWCGNYFIYALNTPSTSIALNTSRKVMRQSLHQCIKATNIPLVDLSLMIIITPVLKPRTKVTSTVTQDIYHILKQVQLDSFFVLRPSCSWSRWPRLRSTHEHTPRSSPRCATLPAFHCHKLPRCRHRHKLLCCRHFIDTNCHVAGISSSQIATLPAIHRQNRHTH